VVLISVQGLGHIEWDSRPRGVLATEKKTNSPCVPISYVTGAVYDSAG
jgi:hypothetical protein